MKFFLNRIAHIDFFRSSRIGLCILIMFTSLLHSCTQEVSPTTENINSIFESKDFTIQFILNDDHKESMSFIDDLIVYKSNSGTQRRTISYDEALLINEFIKNQFSLHKDEYAENSKIIILNTAKKVTLKIPDYESDYRQLIDKLDL